jgi:zinc transporter ZupT
MARSLAELERGERRRAIFLAALRCGLVCTAILTIYFIAPFDGAQLPFEALLALTAGIIVFVVVLTWQVRLIFKADLPELRAIEALVLAGVLFIVVFSFAYVALSDASSNNFTEKLDRVGSLYFTIVTFATIGFGDIAAKSDVARVFVIVQIVGDLIFIAVILRLVFGASRMALRRSPHPHSPDGALAPRSATFDPYDPDPVVHYSDQPPAARQDGTDDARNPDDPPGSQR